MQIKTNQAYEVALFRIWELMDAKLGTLEGEELERLSIVVEAYEDVHFSIGEVSDI